MEAVTVIILVMVGASGEAQRGGSRTLCLEQLPAAHARSVTSLELDPSRYGPRRARGILIRFREMFLKLARKSPDRGLW